MNNFRKFNIILLIYLTYTELILEFKLILELNNFKCLVSEFFFISVYVNYTIFSDSTVTLIVELITFKYINDIFYTEVFSVSLNQKNNSTFL